MGLGWAPNDDGGSSGRGRGRGLGHKKREDQSQGMLCLGNGELNIWLEVSEWESSLAGGEAGAL